VGLSNGQGCGSCATLSLILLFFCSVIFFRPPGSLCKEYYSVQLKHFICLSYYGYACDLNILGTRIEVSVLLFRTGV
jgi:bacteriorhodopsin